MLKKVEDSSNSSIAALMENIGIRARQAAGTLALATTDQKNAALHAMAKVVRQSTKEILAANAIDLKEMEENGQTSAFIDRGTLTPERIESMAAGIESIAALNDPVGEIIASWTRPNGLRIERVRTPLGVVGVIYESRPNVTADAGTLCLKAGNAVILRGGSDTHQTASAIHECLCKGLEAAGLTTDAIQLVPTKDREAVGVMLGGISGNLDVIVPRGGKSLVGRVQQEARVPVFAHLEGIVHVYVHEKADPKLTESIVVNSKMRRTGICGAAESLLIDRSIANSMLPNLVNALRDAGCRIRADELSQSIIPDLESANEADWGTEYLDSIISVKVVDDINEAITHIGKFGSHHTDCIITDDQSAADSFMQQVDSAIVMHNASTQFADGGEFGMGAEIGIATGRMHARGPVGVEQLTSFKYRVHGNGQTRN